MSRELKRSAPPDRLKLENQCISAIAFGGMGDDDDEDNPPIPGHESLTRDDPLRAPLWILVINIVAMEMLRSKLPPGTLPFLKKTTDRNMKIIYLFAGPSRYRAQSAPGPLSLMPASQMGMSMMSSTRPFGSGSSDEDPYSVAGSGSSGSSGNNNRPNGGSKGSSPPTDRPPKLPPRDTTTTIYGASIWARPLESQLRYAEKGSNANSGGHNSRKDGNNNNKVKSKRSTGDDPYYCGLRARIPNFVKKKKKSTDSSTSASSSKLSSNKTSSTSLMNLGKAGQPVNQQVHHPMASSHHPFWWHSRLYSDNAGQFSKLFH